MQRLLKNIFFLVFFTTCTLIKAPSETALFISTANTYYEKLSSNPQFLAPTELSKIKNLLPKAKKSLRDEIAKQKNHSKRLKKDVALNQSVAPNVEEAQLQLQASLRNAFDISPLKAAIAQAEWILAPSKDRLNKKAILAVSGAEDSQAQLADAEEQLDTAWKNQQQNKP